MTALFTLEKTLNSTETHRPQLEEANSCVIAPPATGFSPKGSIMRRCKARALIQRSL
jgi:hypothetical protein